MKKREDVFSVHIHSDALRHENFITCLRRDPSALSLTVSNLATVVLAVVQGWDLAVLMWIYWTQSVIIGLANFVRILNLREFSTKGMRVNNRPVSATRETKIGTAFFFLCHYGLFHLAYFVFLISDSPLDLRKAVPVMLCVALFLVNHSFSFLYNLKRDLATRPNIGSLMFFPYARVIPMHLTIILGSMLGRGTAKLILFMLLKTTADLLMHATEHSRGKNPNHRQPSS